MPSDIFWVKELHPTQRSQDTQRKEMTVWGLQGMSHQLFSSLLPTWTKLTLGNSKPMAKTEREMATVFAHHPNLSARLVLGVGDQLPQWQLCSQRDEGTTAFALQGLRHWTYHLVQRAQASKALCLKNWVLLHYNASGGCGCCYAPTFLLKSYFGMHRTYINKCGTHSCPTSSPGDGS